MQDHNFTSVSAVNGTDIAPAEGEDNGIDVPAGARAGSDGHNGTHPRLAGVDQNEHGLRPASHTPEDLQGGYMAPVARGTLEEPEDRGEYASRALMESYNQYRVCGCEPGACEHGAWSPRAADTEESIGDAASSNGKSRQRWASFSQEVRERLKSTAQRSGLDGAVESMFTNSQRQTTRYLADRHGMKHGSRMYLGYYFPFLSWIGQYRWAYFRGDFVAALTMASFYIPMALSYAENLGHVPPINGLYAFVFNPLIYAFLGTVPQMVVGPEAAGSLLVGTVVRSSVDNGHSTEDEGMMHARIAGVVTFMAGAIILIAGLTRLGFLESVLSRPFLRGFISAIGIVILADQLIPETGLMDLARKAGVDHQSSWNKLVFLFENLGKAHGPTTAVSFISFAIIMICRYVFYNVRPQI
jgi:Sulfate permease family